MSTENVQVCTPIPEALKAFAEGQILIVMDNEDRENEGDLIMAAEHATPEKLAFIVRHTTGIICAPMSADRARELNLPPMVAPEMSTDPNGTAFTITVDSKDASTGVSAADRATTFVQLADPSCKAIQFRRPGHIFPLVAKSGGVWERDGHTEASFDLCRLSGCKSNVGVIGEMVKEDGSMMRFPDCVAFGKEHKIMVITIEQLLQYRLDTEPGLREKAKPVSQKKTLAPFLHGVRQLVECEIPIHIGGDDLGIFTVKLFYSSWDNEEHVIVERGNVAGDSTDPILTRIHSECFTGDVLGSQRCDCGQQLARALKLISQRGRGIVIYNAGHEGRGIGLVYKLMAYHLQQHNHMDTYEANRALGFEDDLRRYDSAVGILKYMGIKKIELLTSNPNKIGALSEFISLTTSLDSVSNTHNQPYLDAKKKRHHGIGGIASVTSPAFYDEMRTITVPGEKSKSLPFALPSVPKEIAAQLRIGLVYTAWNQDFVLPFFERVKAIMFDSGVLRENLFDLIVPGTLETAVGAKHLAEVYNVHAVLLLGVLIKGESMHFEMVCNSVSTGHHDTSRDTGVCLLNGIQACLTEKQAEERYGDDSLLAQSLTASTLYMASLKQSIEARKPPAKQPSPLDESLGYNTHYVASAAQKLSIVANGKAH